MNDGIKEGRDGVLGPRVPHPSRLTPHEALDHLFVPPCPHVKTWNHLHSQKRESGIRLIPFLQLLLAKSRPGNNPRPSPRPEFYLLGQPSGAPTVQQSQNLQRKLLSSGCAQGMDYKSIWLSSRQKSQTFLGTLFCALQSLEGRRALDRTPKNLQN